ncbi:MAG: hypothetical protein ACE5GW_04025 [Planctomycetota bacterium]
MARTAPEETTVSPDRSKSPELSGLLRRAGRRMLLARGISGAVWGVAASLLAATLLVVAHRLLAPAWSLTLPLTATLAAGPLIGIAAALILSRKDDLRAALEIEGFYTLHQRLSSVLFATERGIHPQAAEALIRDGEEHARRIDVRRALPLRRPRGLLPGAPLLLAFLAVCFLLPPFDLLGARTERERVARREKRAAAREEVLKRRLRALTEMAPKSALSPKAQKALARLGERPSIKRGDTRPAGRKRALADLERLRQELRRERARPQMKNLERFLGGMRSASEGMEGEEARKVARALSGGKLDEAARGFRDLARRLERAAKQGGLSAAEKGALRRDLERLLKKVGENPALQQKITDALSKLDSSALGDLSKLLGMAASDLSDLARLMRERDLLDQTLDEIRFTEDELAQLPSEWSEDGAACPKCGKPGGL